MAAHVAVFIAAALSAAAPQAAREPVPAQAEIDKARRAVRQVLEKDYRAAVDRRGRSDLAKKLVGQAAGAARPDERYALLSDAIDHAAAAGDFRTLFGAADAVASSFDVPAREARARAVEIARASAAAPGDRSAAAVALLSLFDDSMEAGDFLKAAAWAAEAERTARGANDAVVAQSAREMAAEAEEAAKEASRVPELAAREPAALSAADKSALGRHLLFVRGDRERGLALLSDGEHGAPREAAGLEASARTASDLFSAGGAWLSLSEKAQGPAKRRYAAHGRRLRDGALRDATGIERTRLDSEARPRIALIKASCGPVDITARMSAEIKTDPRRPFCVFDEYVTAPDPAPENPRMLVEYTVDGRRFSERPARGAPVFPGIPAGGVVRPDAGRRFEVVLAHYGAGVRFVDATENARRAIRGPYAPFNGNAGGGDPCPGQVKTLVVVFDWHGRRAVRAVREGETESLH